MARYHINPETGNANTCSAKVQCRFGISDSDHLPNKAEAMKAAENQMAKKHTEYLSETKNFREIESKNKNKLDEIISEMNSSGEHINIKFDQKNYERFIRNDFDKYSNTIRKRAMMSVAANIYNHYLTNGKFRENSGEIETIVKKHFKELQQKYSDGPSTNTIDKQKSFDNDLKDFIGHMEHQKKDLEYKREKNAIKHMMKKEKISSSYDRASKTDSEYVQSRVLGKTENYNDNVKDFVNRYGIVRITQSASPMSKRKIEKYSDVTLTNDGDSIKFDGWNGKNQFGFTVNGKKFLVNRGEEPDRKSWSKPYINDGNTELHVRSYNAE